MLSGHSDFGDEQQGWAAPDPYVAPGLGGHGTKIQMMALN